MKRFHFCLIALVICSAFFALDFKTIAQNEIVQTENSPAVSPNIVISQFQVAGGTATDEFVELHNTSANQVDLNGLRLVYRSTAGTNDVQMVEWTSSTIVPAGGYYLIATSTYDGTVPSNINYNTSTVSMAAAGGGLAIRNGATNTGVIFDSVGYGTATNAFVETAVTGAPAANAGQIRANNGCQDTDNNANDFSTVNPAAPRNALTTPNACGSTGGGANLLAGGGANPTTVAPGAATLLFVNVFPAATPPSTNITVTGNLTNIGGSASQQFFDDGTNGDATAGDNTFSYLATIPAAKSGGIYNVTAVAADAQTRTANVSINITVNAPVAGEDHLLLGNPSSATSDVANENNYLMIKPQYSLSYNRSKAEANWVAWRLDSSWIGSADRQDDFRPDDTLPAAWYHVQDNDYSGSGYDRGHMTPSGDRTRSVPDNSATFLMTNILPQLGANNQGPWNDFENYLRSLAQAGNEIYIVSGGAGVAGTIAGGKIVVPQVTWKVVLVLPNGNNDIQRIGKGTRTIAIIVPNQGAVDIRSPWRNYRVRVDEVENLTGYNFFSKVPKNTQELVERRKDRQ